MKASARHSNTDFVMFLRAIAINALAAAVVFLAYRGGWIAAVIDADTVYISRIIASMALLGLGLVLIRVFKISSELNVARGYHWLIKDGVSRQSADSWLESTSSRVAEFVGAYRRATPSDKPILVDQFKLSMASKNALIGALEEWLIILGLVGTVVGMRLAVGTIDPEAFRDINLLIPILKSVLGDFFIAFDTTIVGACTALLLDVNLKWVLRPGTVQLTGEAVEIGVLYG